jgi:hypothetical protein
MSTANTVLHIQGHDPAAAERALETIFAREDRPRIFRLEGTYSAVLERVIAPELEASYRYLICRPPAGSTWTPLLELGNRTEGLDVELSRALAGAAVVTLFAYGEGVSGYRVARGGALVDRYTSDPLFFAEEGDGAMAAEPSEVERQRGRPERFADLLPSGTAPEDFARVVLRPGWWESHEEQETGPAVGVGEEEDELVDEVDRMRCLGLALELWAPDEYPFAEELEELPNRMIGPAVALAFA